MFSVIEKASGQWIGRLGPWRPEGWPGNEVGWGLTPSAWARATPPRARPRRSTKAFATLGWQAEIHCIDARNENSKAVARRLGSRYLRDAMLPAPFNQPAEIWGQSRDEWLTRRAAQ